MSVFDTRYFVTHVYILLCMLAAVDWTESASTTPIFYLTHKHY